MKNTIFIFLLFCISSSAFSQVRMIPQDTIVMVKGKDIIGTVTEVNPGFIVCSVGDSMEAVNRVILPEKVIMIKYANGKTEVPDNNTGMKPVPEFTAEYMFAKGQSDAKQFYTGNSAMWITAILTLIFFPIGLLSLALTQGILPKKEKWGVSNIEFLNDENYIKGYKKQISKKNALKAFFGLLIGFGAFIVLTFAILFLAFL